MADERSTAVRELENLIRVARNKHEELYRAWQAQGQMCSALVEARDRVESAERAAARGRITPEQPRAAEST